jgi:glutamyl-tRNA reductase
LAFVPTSSPGSGRGAEIVHDVLRENGPRWELLSEADRERVAALASAVVRRLLHEPTRMLRDAAGEGTSYRYVHALQELFGLEGALSPLEDSSAEVTRLDARRQRRSR